MITFYGYAVRKDGKYLGYRPHRDKSGRFYSFAFYKKPKFPVVCGTKQLQERTNGHLGEVVRVKLTMEEEVTK